MRRQAGFTFIEMLAASTILLFILFAAYNVIDTNQRIAVHQEEIAEMDAAARTALDLMVTDIREAGLNPALIAENTAAAPFISVPTGKMNVAIDIRSDYDGNGTFDGPNESVRYEWKGSTSVTVADLVRTSPISGGTEEVIARNVRKPAVGQTPLEIFTYLDVNHALITDITKVNSLVCKAVRVQLTVQSSKKDRISKRFREVTLRETVVLRNLRDYPLPLL